jgi:hypothetical protein
MGHHGCGRNCFARSHDPAYGLYAASRVRFAGLQKRSPPLTPLRDNRLPTVRRTFQYQSRYWRESFVCTLDTGRLMGGPFSWSFSWSIDSENHLAGLPPGETVGLK